jgi:hypothetical protein
MAGSESPDGETSNPSTFFMANQLGCSPERWVAALKAVVRDASTDARVPEFHAVCRRVSGLNPDSRDAAARGSFLVARA